MADVAPRAYVTGGQRLGGYRAGGTQSNGWGQNVSTDLKIDMASLKGLAADLKTISDEFKNADNNSEDAADATGHDELRDKVQDFADKWRVKRDEMGENVTKLQGVLQSIVDTFTQVDEGLAKALEEKASEATEYKGYKSV